MSFGSTPVSTTSLSQNQFPASAVAVPNHAGGNFSALRGLNPQTDSNGNEEADASVAMQDGANVTQGTTTDVAVTGDTAGTVSAKLRGMNKIWAGVSDLVNNLLHANIKQVNGTPVVTGGANGLLAVGGPVASGSANADNPVKMGGVFNTTQPTVTNGQVVDLQSTARGARIVATGVDGFSVTANAGTNLNTSLLAVESGGNLATLVTRTPALGQSTMANSQPVAIASNQGAVPVGVTAGTAFDGNAGTISANTLRTVAGGAATGTKSNVASSASSVTILASNTSRKGAIFYNDSTQILYLDLSGGTASNSSYSVQVPSQGFFELPGPTIYNGAITGIWAAANGNARCTEFS